MRRTLACAAAVLLVLPACGGNGPGGSGDEPEPTDPTLPPGPTVPVRVTGTLQEVDDGWLLCPGSVAPCWPVVDAPGPDDPTGLVVATGTWDRDTIRLDEVEKGPPGAFEFTNPCLDDGDSTDEVWQDSAAFDEYAASIPDVLAAIWRVDGVLVMVVTDDPSPHRSELAERGVEGVCVADLGFEHTLAELESALEEAADEWSRWGERGWVVLSGSLDVSSNRAVVAFDQIDQELRDEIESTWGDLVEIRANVEVLDGSVEQLELPAAPNEIPIATQPRGAGGMDALGQFTLRLDDELGCFFFESDDESRVKPIWPFGYRALPGPARVLSGRGEVVAVADQELELGGGFGQVLPDSDDPTDCGAESVWVINPG